MRLVSARARQLSYRLKNRRTAIITRRENDASLNAQSRTTSDIWRDANGHGLGNGRSSNASPSGFVAVNAHRPEAESEDKALSSPFMFSHANTDNVTIINGTSIKGASPTTRAELMKKFFTTADRQARGYDEASGTVNPLVRPRPRGSDLAEYSIYNTTSTPVAIPSTPSSLLPLPKSSSHEKDDGGPFKLEMVARMEELQRGERVIPPCDRCRRLHMDCLKNLTACMGCTKKHAKCSWREVKEEELRAAYGSAPVPAPREQLEQDRGRAPTHNNLAPSPGTSTTTPAERPHEPHHPPNDPYQSHHTRRESAPGAPHIGPGSGNSVTLPPIDKSPRRAVSETEGRGRTYNERPHQGHPPPRHAEEEDPDANQRLMQAILDTVDHHARVAAAVQEKERGAERAGDGGNDREADRERDREREHEHERDRDRRLVQT